MPRAPLRRRHVPVPAAQQLPSAPRAHPYRHTSGLGTARNPLLRPLARPGLDPITSPSTCAWADHSYPARRARRTERQGQAHARHPAPRPPNRIHAQITRLRVPAPAESPHRKTVPNGGSVRALTKIRTVLRLDLLAAQRAYVCTLAEDLERPVMPRTARLARHGVAAHGALRPTSDGDLQQTGGYGPTRARPGVASLDHITLSNQGRSGRTRAEPLCAADGSSAITNPSVQTGSLCAPSVDRICR